MRAALLVLASSVILLSTAAASAQLGRGAADRQALQRYEQGVNAYNAARYQEAATAFEEAYQLSPRPLLLFNLGNAYERLDRYADAADALRRYQAAAPIAEHAELSARIASLEQLSTRRTAGGATDLMLPGIIVTAGGGALLATGLVFAILALDAGAGVTDGEDATCSRVDDGRLICQGGSSGRLGDYETFALVADIGLIGGGVVAAAGLTLIVLAALGVPGGASAALAPRVQVGANGAWAGVAGAF